MSDYYDREMAAAARPAPSTMAWRVPRFACVATCSCGARFDANGWKDMPLVRVVRVDGAEPAAVRRCLFCRSEVTK